MTIDVRNDGRTFGAHGNSNIQNQKLGRSLMTPAAVKRMSRKHCLIFIEGQYPIFDEKAIPFTPRSGSKWNNWLGRRDIITQ